MLWMARSDENFQHGKKRRADGDPDGAQPLTKRFGRLQLGMFRCVAVAGVRLTAFCLADNDGPISGARASRNGSPYPSSPAINDAMLVDDTKYTTYIHNLDQELAEADTQGEGLVLLPLAAKMISVPESILSTSTQGKELVLYTEPTSLSVPREQDCVRKAILDSRARARAEANQSSCQSDDGGQPSSSQVVLDTPRPYNGDPMDLDFDS